MGAALGPDTGAAGAAMAALAQAAQDDGAKWPGNSGGGAYSGGGGGGRSSGSDSGSNPFASLFGGGAKNNGSRGPTAETFGRAPQNDIWHTGTTMNLFEIVSGKIGKVSGRVLSRF
jgi:hypothetical protein